MERCIASNINSKVKARKKVLAKQPYPRFFHANSQAKASLCVHVMFWVQEIRSTSAQSLAGSASTKR
jgi:hypothetical protein